MSLKFGFEADDVVKSGRLKQKDLKKMRSWIDGLGVPEVPDQMLVLALLSCNNDTGKAKKTLDAYFTCKSMGPEIFDYPDINCHELQLHFKLMYKAILPTRTPKNEVIAFAKLVDNTYRTFNLQAHLATGSMTADLVLQKEKNPPSGIVVFYDCKEFAFWLLPKVHLGLIKKFTNYIQEGLLLRVNQIYFVNCGYVIDQVMRMIKACIKAELFQKIISLRNNIDIEDFRNRGIPPECLPSDYGGTAPTLKELHEQNVHSLGQIQEFFRHEQKLRKKYMSVAGNNNVIE